MTARLRRLVITANYWLDVIPADLRDRVRPRWPRLATWLDDLPLIRVPGATRKTGEWQMRSTNQKLCAEIERLDNKIAAIFACLEDMCKVAGMDEYVQRREYFASLERKARRPRHLNLVRPGGDAS